MKPAQGGQALRGSWPADQELANEEKGRAWPIMGITMPK
jgi:hypothetical protein